MRGSNVSGVCVCVCVFECAKTPDATLTHGGGARMARETEQTPFEMKDLVYEKINKASPVHFMVRRDLMGLAGG